MSGDGKGKRGYGKYSGRINYSYEYDFDAFREELEDHTETDGESSVVHTHITQRLRVPYGFVGRELEDGRNEIRCFTESDSILVRKMVECREPLYVAREDMEKKEWMSVVLRDIEESEERFSRPLTRKSMFMSYYMNPRSFDTWDAKLMNVKSVVKWLFTRKKPMIPSAAEIGCVLRVVKPSFGSEEHGISFTWLGHSSLLVRLNGINIITDPVFGDRASFLSFLGPKRHVQPPCTVEELPDIDIVFISHDHYDHLDVDAVRRINARSPAARWYAPLGVDKYLEERGVRNVKGMNWGSEDKTEGLVGKDAIDNSGSVMDRKRSVSVTCVPAQHWGSRCGYDMLTRLWCGWVVSVDGKTFYYTGDTGFCRKEFLKVGLRFDIDLAGIPIGCYEPSWFMHGQHISPSEAVAVHRMVKARRSVGLHWGTYDMGSSEGFLRPQEDLQRAVEESGLQEGEFVVVSPGETKDC